MSHDPNLNQSKPSQEPSSLFRWEGVSNEVRGQGTQGKVPVDPPHCWMLPKQGVLLVKSGMAYDASRLPVVNDHSGVGYAC